MGLDRTKLEMVRELGNGGWQARCPACAEAGQDRKGEHLRVSPDGRFGCCVFAGDREHRRRIFALAGDHGQKGIKVRVARAKSALSARSDLLGRLRSEELRVKSAEWGKGRIGTLGTGETSEVCKVRSAELGKEENEGEVGTLGTGISDPRAYANEPMEDDLFIRELIGCQEGVPSVPEERGNGRDGRNERNGKDGKDKDERDVRDAGRRLPFLMADGTVVIPFNSPERYQWWWGGQPIRQTVAELKERRELDGSPF